MEDKIRVTTENIKDHLKEISESFSTDPSQIDFEIVDKKLSQTQEGIRAIYTVDFINKESDMLSKVIDIEVNNSSEPKNAFIRVDCTKLNSTLNVDIEDIIKVINKKLALHSIVYGIQEDNMPLIAKEIQKRLNPERGKFKVLIATSTPPINGKDSELKTLFKLNTVGQIDEKGNINFKEKNFAVAVDIGTMVAEFIKPTKGVDGYDIFGNILKAQDGKELQKINSVKIDASDMEKVEDDLSIKFISKKRGALILKNGMFHIEENIKVNKADIKTGNINLKDISNLKVGENMDVFMEDIVGAGIKVAGKKVVVNGSVGPKARIEADVVDIKGIVHKEATIVAKVARIKNLNGTLVANEAFIENASYANIEAESKVTIDNCISCNMLSPSVEIKKEMLSSNIVTSSKEVILNNVVGSNNKISIKPLEIKQIAMRYEELLSQKKLILNELESFEKELNMLKRKFESNFENFNKARKLIKELQSKNIRVSNYLLNIIEKFRSVEDDYKKKQVIFSNIEANFNQVLDKIKELETSYKYAHIIIKGEIDEGNLIEFGDKLSRRLINKQRAIKIYVREVNGKEEIVIEPLS